MMTDESFQGGRPEAPEFKRGPGGRPTRAEAERRHGAMLETAVRLFLAHGLDAVSIEEIAKQSGVAKRFIYARYGGKPELFVAAIEHRFADQLETLHALEIGREPAERGLLKLAQNLLDLVLLPDAVALHRLFVTAAPRFPALARKFIDRNRNRVFDDVDRMLKAYAARGDITLTDPRVTTEQFLISIIGIPRQLALFGIREPPAKRQRRLRIAVRLFLDGCRPRR